MEASFLLLDRKKSTIFKKKLKKNSRFRESSKRVKVYFKNGKKMILKFLKSA
jgi:hypothetical protein